MKIGLNGQRILIENPAGPEIFTINLYKALARNDTKNKYIIYVPSNPTEKFINNITGGNPNFEFKVLPTLGKISWTQIILMFEIWKHPIDIFFSPVHTIPFLINPFIKVVPMIHGFEHKTNQELKKYYIRYWTQEFMIFLMQLRANKIIVPSGNTYSNILSLKQNENTTKVIYEGVSEEFKPRSTIDVNDVLRSYGLDNKKYFMFVSTIQPRKNIPNMIEGFSLAIKEYPELNNYTLVISGKKGWNYEESLEAPKKFGVEDKVKFIGWVPQSDLPCLLSGADGYVNFSVDEGFGLTLIEALASGIPAAVSNIKAHMEVGGELPIYANPKDVNQIKTAIIYLTKFSKDQQYQEKLAIWASRFTWDETARKTIEVFNNLINR